MTDTYTKWNWEHPAVAGLRGLIPDVADGVDEDVFQRTVEKVIEVWEFDRCWGWDFPMAAMGAAKAGRPDLAVDVLMRESPKNRYTKNGHNTQNNKMLPLYLPGNGGLLTAVALMAAGWDGADDRPAPGFPREGWVVRSEGLRPPL